MATLRALDTPDDLERFVELTKLIRALETERDALKDTITEALQHEPPDGPNGEQSVDFDGYHITLASRARWQYSGAVEKAEADLRALKTKERANGGASLQGHTFYPKCSVHRARSEDEARERKANVIAAHLAASGLTAPDVEAWTRPRQVGEAQGRVIVSWGQHMPGIEPGNASTRQKL